MQKKETAIEVKVGALVLFGTALLAAFVFILGDFSLGDGFKFYVEFDNAGGLKPGADVAIAGINVGSVESIRFLTKEKSETDSSGAVAVRAHLRIDTEFADAVREKSEFFITTRGVLGEPYIEVVTKNFESAAIAEDSVMRGVDPPRMDIIIAKATELMTVMTDLLNDPEIHTKDLIKNTAKLMKDVDEFVVDNREDLDATVDNVRDTSKEAAQLLAALNVAVEDGKNLQGTLRDVQGTARNANKIAARVEGKIDPILADATATMSNAKKVSESADRLVTDNEPKISETIDNVHGSSVRLANLSKNADTMVGNISSGKGTVGALLADREIYDDLKEMLKTIKQRPWKIVWKE